MQACKVLCARQVWIRGLDVLTMGEEESEGMLVSKAQWALSEVPGFPSVGMRQWAAGSWHHEHDWPADERQCVFYLFFFENWLKTTNIY